MRWCHVFGKYWPLKLQLLPLRELYKLQLHLRSYTLQRYPSQRTVDWRGLQRRALSAVQWNAICGYIRQDIQHWLRPRLWWFGSVCHLHKHLGRLLDVLQYLQHLYRCGLQWTFPRRRSQLLSEICTHHRHPSGSDRLRRAGIAWALLSMSHKASRV